MLTHWRTSDDSLSESPPVVDCDSGISFSIHGDNLLSREKTPEKESDEHIVTQSGDLVRSPKPCGERFLLFAKKQKAVIFPFRKDSGKIISTE